MFDGLFSFVKTPSVDKTMNTKNKIKHKYWLFYDTVNNNTDKVINRINNYRINVNDTKYLDKYGQSILHIASKNSNIDLIKKLLDKDMNKNLKNSSGETPVDIAIKYGNKNIIDEFYYDDQILLKDENKMLKNENVQLIKDNSDLKNNNNNLIENNKKLTTLYNTSNNKYCDIYSKYTSEVLSKKRLREQYDELQSNNKKIKLSHDSTIHEMDILKNKLNDLTQENNVLKITIDNMRSSFKKK
jgi:hypothetical protein